MRRAAAAGVAGSASIAAALMAATMAVAATAPSIPEDVCAYWRRHTPAEWRAALDKAQLQWESVKPRFGDIMKWRVQRAKSDPYAHASADKVIRLALQSQAYIKSYGPISDEEAFQDQRDRTKVSTVTPRFDESGRALDGTGLAYAAIKERRSHYEVVRDGLAFDYRKCTDDPQAIALSKEAHTLHERDIFGPD